MTALWGFDEKHPNKLVLTGLGGYDVTVTVSLGWVDAYVGVDTDWVRHSAGGGGLDPGSFCSSVAGAATMEYYAAGAGSFDGCGGGSRDSFFPFPLLRFGPARFSHRRSLPGALLADR